MNIYEHIFIIYFIYIIIYKIYPYIYSLLFCKITVWYKQINNIIMRTQKIIKKIIFAFLLEKIKFKKK